MIQGGSLSLWVKAWHSNGGQFVDICAKSVKRDRHTEIVLIPEQVDHGLSNEL